MNRNELTEKQEAWLKALESGAHKQVTGNLRVGGGMCCLGVATHVVDPEHHALKINGWYRADYEGDYDWDYLVEIGSDEATAPPEVVETLHLSNTEGRFRFGYHHEGHQSLIELNDDAGKTFPEIAAFIRSHPWTVFTNFDMPEGAQ